ncbi:MAG: glycyl radical protein [Clostridia bacterium]|nr:glycyl radical protein [Clostridia bacterium]
MKFDTSPIEKTKRIERLLEAFYNAMPEIEPARAELMTESYSQTEDQPEVERKSKAFQHILENIPIIIRDDELIVGSTTLQSRGCQTYPEFSYEWLEAEFDTVATRSADPFNISDDTKKRLKEADKYWKNKTTSELATAYMDERARRAMAHNIFTPGNYFYNGIGHLTVKYWTVIDEGLESIIERAQKVIAGLCVGEPDAPKRRIFCEAVIRSCRGVIRYAERYAELAEKMAASAAADRRRELLKIAEVCRRVPGKPARSFYEACQAFWFVQQLLQVESSGHSISPGRFDQYMYPYYKKDLESGAITREAAQELLDCIWIKLNDINKCRDAASAEGFAGYSLFQNLIVGGQDREGNDATNDLSSMCIEASMHTGLPMPSLSIRVWNGSPHEILVKAVKLTRTGIGLPAYYNDEVIIPALMNRGIPLEEARDYNIIGCVEPQVPGKTDGWHDAAFFNMLRPLELVFTNGHEDGELVTVETGDVLTMTSFDQLFDAYKKQMHVSIALMVNAINAIDYAHAERSPLPFESCLVDGTFESGRTVEEGGAIYNFTGPQGFGIANVADALFAIKKLVFDEKKYTMADFKQAMADNFGKGLTALDAEHIVKTVCANLKAKGEQITPDVVKAVYAGVVASKEISSERREFYDRMLADIEDQPKYGNDIDEIDLFAREVAYTYTRPLETFKNPRGGIFQAGLYPVSANVPLGAQSGATPDGRLSGAPIADGIGPAQGRDKLGPTAAANSVAKVDHLIASNGTLYNQKFHPSALANAKGIDDFITYLRTYFNRKGMHVQFNVVSRETLLDAQKNPDKYRSLVVRVAGYSALFTTLSRSLQDDIISRTTQANTF